jgi:hypothetical protein
MDRDAVELMNALDGQIGVGQPTPRPALRGRDGELICDCALTQRCELCETGAER